MNNSKKNLTFSYLNIPSLSIHTEELTTLISEQNLTFDVFRVSKTNLRLTKAPLNSVKIPGYNFEFTATEYSNGGTAIYLKKSLNYKLRKDLGIYKSKQLESTFIEVNLNNEKVAIACIYRHPTMELSECNSDYLTNPLDTVSSENKTIVLLGPSMTKIATLGSRYSRMDQVKFVADSILKT